METIITIDGKKIPFKATANTPRLYRIKFRRDLMHDMSRLAKQHKKKKFDIPDLEIGTIDEWMDGFKMFDIYEILPQLIELWGANVETQVESKKNKMKAIQK